ncbi:hypothetical protein SK128_005528 [Halocaridina rubra]|uniref:Transmembrane protein 138 n=1 Tax=Halocaridina rubra TaxID=373956 RepID=A0AAN8XFN5_HALRR
MIMTNIHIYIKETSKILVVCCSFGQPLFNFGQQEIKRPLAHTVLFTFHSQNLYFPEVNKEEEEDSDEGFLFTVNETMAWASVDRYRWLSGASMMLLLSDLILNSIFLLFAHDTLLTLVIYIIQDVCLIFSLILLFLALFSTSLSQAGFVGELVSRFQWCLLIAVTYLGLSLSFHTWSLMEQWQQPAKYIWTHGLVALFTSQRVVGGAHYYLYKRTILHLSDKDFYTKLPVGKVK